MALGEPNGWKGRLVAGEPFVATVLEMPSIDKLFYELGAPPRASDILYTAGVR